MSPTLFLLVGFLTGAVATYLLTPPVVRLATRLGVVDQPGGRRVHTTPTPRLGGLAVFLSLALVALAWTLHGAWSGEQTGLFGGKALAFLIPCLLVFVTGVADDVWNLGPLPRLVLETLAAVSLIQSGYVIDVVWNPLGDPIELGLLAFPITLVWFLGVTNAFNLIDGLDGLLSSVGVVVLCGCVVIAVLESRPASAILAVGLAGALVGFLPRNWEPAKIFLGDSGSLLVGFTIAGVSLQVARTPAGPLAMHVPLLLCALPIGETLFTLARRYVRRQPLFVGDRSHVHHVLLKRGWSVTRVVLTLTAVTGLLVACAVLTRYWRDARVLVLITVLLGCAWVSVRWLGYVELRVFWVRLKNDVLRRDPDVEPRLLTLARAGQQLDGASCDRQVGAALERLVAETAVELLVLELSPAGELALGVERVWVLGGTGQGVALDDARCKSLPLERWGRLVLRVAPGAGYTDPDLERFLRRPLCNALTNLESAQSRASA